MKKIFLLILSCFFLFISKSAIAKERPQPAPVEIQFTLLNQPKENEPAQVSLKLISTTDIDVEIEIFLPEGVINGFQDNSFQMSFSNFNFPYESGDFSQVVKLNPVQLKANEEKEYILPLSVTNTLKHVVKALIKSRSKRFLNKSATVEIRREE